MDLTQHDLSGVGRFGDDRLARVDEVTWSLFVWDPEGIAPDEVGDLTEPALTELASQLGCVFAHCVDYDSVDDVRYYEWLLQLPQSEHSRRGPDDLPLAIARIRDLLRGMLPAGLTDWQIGPARDDTRRLAIAQLMRAAYADLVSILDDTLLHRRTGGAEDLDPRAKLWHEDQKTMVGDYAIWLGQDPRVDYPRWLVLTAGVWPETDEDNQVTWGRTGPSIDLSTRSLDRFDLGDGQPVLLLPRPSTPIFTARVTSGSIPGKGVLFERRAAAVGSTHQWTARDPKALVANVLRDLNLLFPGLLLP